MPKRKAPAPTLPGFAYDHMQTSFGVIYNGQDTGKVIRQRSGTPHIWVVDDDPEPALNRFYGPGTAAERAVKLWKEPKI